MFYTFGLLGFIWCCLWVIIYVDVNPSIREYDEEYGETAKVTFI